MKTLLLLLIPLQIFGQPAAILNLSDGTYILNAPDGRDWTSYKVTSVNIFDDPFTYVHNSEVDKIKYFGNWRVADTIAIPEPTGNCYCSWSQSTDDSLVIRFTNTKKFEWIGETMSHHGIAAIYFNDVFIKEVDTYSPDNKRLTVNWSIDNLDLEKVHSFKLIATGRKNEASTGRSVVIQSFTFTNVPTVPPVIPPIDSCLTDTIYIEKIIYINDTIYLQPKIFINADTIEYEIK